MVRDKHPSLVLCKCRTAMTKREIAAFIFTFYYFLYSMYDELEGNNARLTRHMETVSFQFWSAFYEEIEGCNKLSKRERDYSYERQKKCMDGVNEVLG